ncbi:MAG: hypothetical protein JNL39_21530 [Opitutaceae bacterium]|nr:hypothetical protein [Opitutaceae bacterium]
MRRLRHVSLPLIALALFAGGCATAPTTSQPAGLATSGATGTASQTKPARTLSELVHETVATIDQMLGRYDAMLKTIQGLSDTKAAAVLLDEIGAYVKDDRWEKPDPIPEEKLQAAMLEEFSRPSRTVLTHTSLNKELVDLSRRLIALNNRTAELAASYAQGKTLRAYAAKMRREVMPLMAQLRALAVADTADTAGIAHLDAETKKILATSRQSLRALERETHSLESEIGGK